MAIGGGLRDLCWGDHGRGSAKPTHQPTALKSRIMEACDGGDTRVLRLVVYKSTIALGDELDTLNVISSFASKMVFEVADMHARGEIANPQGAA